MAWVVTAVGGYISGSAVQAPRERRKAAARQLDAMLAQQAEDARQKAESETGAALSASTSLAASKRRRKASSLLTGGGTPSLGGASSLLGASPNLNQGPQ